MYVHATIKSIIDEALCVAFHIDIKYYYYLLHVQ